jgi:hypothetical protein
MARLKPGVGIAQAEAATDAIYQNIVQQKNLRTSVGESPTERIFAPRIQLHSARTGVSTGVAAVTDIRSQFSQSLILLMCMVGGLANRLSQCRQPAACARGDEEA